MTAPRARSPTDCAVFCSQLNGSPISPRPIRTPFTIPWLVSKMNRQKIPATIEATAQGSSRAMKKIDTPRNPRLSARAVTSASGNVRAVEAAAKKSVRGMAAMTSLSAGSRSTKLRRPTNGVRSSFWSSIRNRLSPNTASVGGRTISPTRISPGSETSRAKRRSLRRSSRRETRPAPRLSAALATAMPALPPLQSCRSPRARHDRVVYNRLST